jgi:hypothetical protein
MTSPVHTPILGQNPPFAESSRLAQALGYSLHFSHSLVAVSAGTDFSTYALLPSFQDSEVVDSPCPCAAQ